MRFKSSRVLVVLVAVCVMTAVAAASASAYTNPILTKSNGEAANTTFTSAATGTSFLQEEGGGRFFECASENSEGSVKTSSTTETGMTTGTTNVTFKGCGSAFGKCKNTTNPGEVKFSVSTALVWIGKESEKKPGILFSILPLSKKPGNGAGGKVKYECTAAAKFEVEGAFVVPITKPTPLLNVLTKTLTIEGTQRSSGVQSTKEFTENGVVGSNNLFSSLDGAAFKQAAEVIEDTQKYKEEVEIKES